MSSFVALQEFFVLYPLDRLPPRKLGPRAGHRRHPWIEAQDRIRPHNKILRSEEERQAAVAACSALCGYVHSNVGVVLDALERSGPIASTRVIYTSDRGDNVGARGLRGRSNLYQESVAVPMLMAGPGIRPGAVETPVSLIDLYPTILDAGAPDRAPGHYIDAHP
jgi:choline-sulfatase